jgi:hypothetical protein
MADDEGSPQSFDFTTAEILRFAQNDSLEAFFRSLLGVGSGRCRPRDAGSALQPLEGDD